MDLCWQIDTIYPEVVTHGPVLLLEARCEVGSGGTWMSSLVGLPKDIFITRYCSLRHLRKSYIIPLECSLVNYMTCYFQACTMNMSYTPRIYAAVSVGW